MLEHRLEDVVGCLNTSWDGDGVVLDMLGMYWDDKWGGIHVE